LLTKIVKHVQKMNPKPNSTKSSWDNAKLTSAVLLILFGIGAFYYLDAHSMLLRVIGLLIIGSIATAIAYNTTIGQQTWQFFLDSKMEVDKMVWPSQDETIQTTVVVVLMVLAMSILLWIFDALLMTLVRYLTGQGT